MVTYELVEENDDRLVYHYYPEDKRDKKPGVIIVNLKSCCVNKDTCAELDFIPLYSELYDICKNKSCYWFYGDPVSNDIIDRLNRRYHPKKGKLDIGEKDYFAKFIKEANLSYMTKEGQIAKLEIELDRGTKIKLADGAWSVSEV